LNLFDEKLGGLLRLGKFLVLKLAEKKIILSEKTKNFNWSNVPDGNVKSNKWLF
jgi:hypothetical protein